MYLTIETESTVYSLPLHKSLVKSSAIDIWYTIESFIPEINAELVDYSKSRIQKSDRVLSLDWQTIVNEIRKETAIKRHRKTGELSCKQAYVYCFK